LTARPDATDLSPLEDIGLSDQAEGPPPDALITSPAELQHELLERFLRSDDDELRLLAAAAVASAAGEGSEARPLLPLLGDDDERVRLVGALGLLRSELSPSDLTALEAALARATGPTTRVILAVALRTGAPEAGALVARALAREGERVEALAACAVAGSLPPELVDGIERPLARAATTALLQGGQEAEFTRRAVARILLAGDRPRLLAGGVTSARALLTDIRSHPGRDSSVTELADRLEAQEVPTSLTDLREEALRALRE
jgi:hypothetical protein